MVPNTKLYSERANTKADALDTGNNIQRDMPLADEYKFKMFLPEM